MAIPVFANFQVPSSKASLGDYSVQPRTANGVTTGPAITTGLNALFIFRGSVPSDAATADLVSASAGLIDAQPLYAAAVGTITLPPISQGLSDGNWEIK